MISGGQTRVTDIGVGRQLLCKEKPNTRATSTCAKKVAATVNAAKRGLANKQQKLWRQMVYTPALLQAQRFCSAKSKSPQFGPDNPYKACTAQVLSDTLKFKGLFGKLFKWSDYLINGAKIIKKLPASATTPPPRLGGNPGGSFRTQDPTK